MLGQDLELWKLALVPAAHKSNRWGDIRVYRGFAFPTQVMHSDIRGIVRELEHAGFSVDTEYGVLSVDAILGYSTAEQRGTVWFGTASLQDI